MKKRLYYAQEKRFKEYKSKEKFTIPLSHTEESCEAVARHIQEGTATTESVLS